MKQTVRDMLRHLTADAKQLRQMLDGTAVPTFAVDSAGRLTLWNKACEKLTGAIAADMIGTRRHRDVFYEESRLVLADLIVQKADEHDLIAFYKGKIERSRMVADGFEGIDFFPRLGKRGKWLFFTAVPLKDLRGAIAGAMETVQDITEQRLAEKKRQDSEARYRLLFESANDAIFVLKEGVIADCNRKALTLFNCPREAMVQHSTLDFSPERQPNGALSMDALEEKREHFFLNVPQLFEWRFRRFDGVCFDAEVSVTRFEIDDIPHAIAIVRDISDRNRLIETLRKREKELDEKTSYLEKVNQALKASLDHREIEKRSVEETILVNLKRFVLPYLEELNNCSLGAGAKAYLDILETNLNDIVSQFSSNIFSKYIDFTPSEIRVADLIRDGKDTKEIAELLSLSPSSIQWHRKNIREKLGLTNKKVNLRTYLSSLKE